MRLPQKFLALPTSLLLLLLSSPTPAHAENEDQSPAHWPYGRPAHAEYSPEDSPHQRRELEAIQSHIIAGHAPVVVKKMSEDESEMFFPEYWGFREQVDQFAIFGNGPADGGAGWSIRKEFEEEEARLLSNASTVLSMRPAFLVRAKQKTSLSQRDIQALAVGRIKSGRNAAAAALALLEKRQFECPAGTSACSNAPSLCCATGETCVTVTDTGIGTIGCCPAGYTCTGTISCVAGNTPCASDIGGGCCIPGDVCATVGCVASSAATSAVTVISTITQSSPTSINLIVVTTIVTPSMSASTLTTTLTASASSTLVATTNTNTASQTISQSATPTTTSASAPVRGSSASASTSDTAQVTTTSTSATDSSCPTGFYACSAYYAGGCCRTGRDCATTDCPSTSSTTLISSGVTIVVPLTGAATTTASGTCATGWYSCAATDGGSCCPSGWSCGLESCTSAGASSTATEAKEGVLLNGGARLGLSPFQLLGVLCLIMFLLLIA